MSQFRPKQIRWVSSVNATTAITLRPTMPHAASRLGTAPQRTAPMAKVFARRIEQTDPSTAIVPLVTLARRATPVTATFATTMAVALGACASAMLVGQGHDAPLAIRTTSAVATVHAMPPTMLSAASATMVSGERAARTSVPLTGLECAVEPVRPAIELLGTVSAPLGMTEM